MPRGVVLHLVIINSLYIVFRGGADFKISLFTSLQPLI